ncbi:MAG TPA: DUF6600 domain-containing protein [Polyangia bacterium]|nr:DUF6600 domain-containing protein [Polyangia bacterium]
MATKHLTYGLLAGLLGLGVAGCWEPEEYAVETGPPPQAPNEQVAYETLAPYGEWVETDVYGSIWCPSVGVVGVGFSPYGYGRWQWTNAGWYYDSYYSWGWLPYHYGNWVSLDICPWGWVPGYLWGPSWVGWYYGYPYPLLPGRGFRPTHVARPPGVHVAGPVRAQVVAPRLDVSSGRLYAGTQAAPGNARLVNPPGVMHGGVAATFSARAQTAPLSAGARGAPSVNGARSAPTWGYHPPAGAQTARPGPGYGYGYSGGGYRAGPAPGVGAVHSAPAPAPVHAAPSGGGVHVGGGGGGAAHVGGGGGGHRH